MPSEINRMNSAKESPHILVVWRKIQSCRNLVVRNTMIAEFQKLSDTEIDLMLKAPVLVCILVAGADGTIDRKEIKEAITQTQKTSSGALSGYLREISQDFEDKLKVLIQSYPHAPADRSKLIIDELHQIDAVFRKMDRGFAALIYQLLKQLAAKIASSSGGLWGMNTITEEEAKYLALSMIHDPAKV